MKKIDIKDYSLENLRRLFFERDIKKFHADHVFKWCYRERLEVFDNMSDISKNNREFLSKIFYFSEIFPEKKHKAKDGTIKYLFRLNDKETIETAFIPEKNRNTICVSTQVGCKFRCKMCASGDKGFVRNLAVSEILNQLLSVIDDNSLEKIDNIVFMGIGEPFDNYGNLCESLEIITDKKGLAVPAHKICVSTCGLVPEILAFSHDFPKIKLSVSLHACDDMLRDYIMPVNKKYTLKELTGALRKISLNSRHKVTLEYVLIRNKNMRDIDINNLAKIAKKITAKVNFITLNGEKDGLIGPDSKELEEFLRKVKKTDIQFTVRKTRGKEISASCGQLRTGETADER
ncbi:MAG: 23S rRNA (adenine(2503)-C(2))-methyltransferase RlmN [Candidatus Omnitrophota bacterium]